MQTDVCFNIGFCVNEPGNNPVLALSGVYYFEWNTLVMSEENM